MVRLGLYWITAFLLHPTSLMEPLSLPVANDTTLSIAIWSGGVCASFSCLFDVLAYFRPGRFAYVGITFAVCTSVLSIIAFIRIGINHTILSPRSPQSIWLLLPLCQVPSIIVAVGRIQYRNSGLYTAGRFCLWAWTTGMLIFVRELCQICSRICLPPSNKPRIHSKRRMICPSASEDFRSYHDPFAGPLAMRYNPMTTYSSFNPIHVQHSVVSLSVLHPYSRPTELAEIPSTGFLPTYHRPPIARGSGTELGQADTSNAGSFHTAEGYWDASPEEEGIPSNKHDTAVNRIMPGSVSVCLPNIPAPAHLPPPLRTNVTPNQGSLNATSSVLPLAGQTSRSSFISRANVASWVDSRDRTPTQSLYVSSTSLDAPNKDKTRPIGEQPPVAISMGSLDPGNSNSQSMERSVVPSLRFLKNQKRPLTALLYSPTC
ncbi:hypothetical protein FRC16_001192 [Serendipita sp. 398]|nr:hypothetical protein FRC16_001192 [Serendipita sp. 398]